MKKQEINDLAKKVLQDIDSLEDVETKKQTKEKKKVKKVENEIEKACVAEVEETASENIEKVEEKDANNAESENVEETIIEEIKEEVKAEEQENVEVVDTNIENVENEEMNAEEQQEEKNDCTAIVKAHYYRRKRIKARLLRLSVLALLLMLSTYTWFTSQKDLTLSNLRGAVEVVENMEVSLDAKTWYQEINLSQAETLFENAQNSRDEALGQDETNRTTALPILPLQLLPVSSTGELNTPILPMYTGTATSTTMTEIEQCNELDAITKKAVDNGYFAFDMYIKNTSRDQDPEDVLQLNLNSAAQVLTQSFPKTIIDEYGNSVARTYNGDATSGLQNTLRVALALYEGDASSTATQKQILEATAGKNVKDVAIWEPNASDHVEYIVANNNKLINASDSNKITFDNGDQVVTYALNADALTVESIENVYDISSTGLSLQNTFKTENIKNAQGEVVDYRINTIDSKPINITSSATDSHEFKIPSNKVCRIRVYVWLEGQDVDCINLASLGGGIELNLGLTKDDDVGNVLKDDRVSYSTQEPTSGDVTATITLEKEIAEAPAGWTFANADKTQITKTYSENTNERVDISCTDGTTAIVQIRIENITD